MRGSVQRNRRPVSPSTKAVQGDFDCVLSILRDQKTELLLKLLNDGLAVFNMPLERRRVATEKGLKADS